MDGRKGAVGFGLDLVVVIRGAELDGAGSDFGR